MILNYKKSSIFYAIFGVLLVLAVAAFGLTRAQSSDVKTNDSTIKDTATDEIKPKTEHNTVNPTIGSGLITVFAMPETNDRERVEKFESLEYLIPYGETATKPDASEIKDRILAEQLRVAQTISFTGLRVEKILRIARKYSDAGQWDEYSKIVAPLPEPFKDLAEAFRTAFDDVKAGNRDAAKERILAFVPKTENLSSEYEQSIGAIFGFISLAKLGFTDEVVKRFQKIKDGWDEPKAKSVINSLTTLIQSPDEIQWGSRIMDDSFRDAVSEVCAYLMDHDDCDAMMDFAVKMYNVGHPSSCVTDPTRSWMSQAIAIAVKKGNLDAAKKYCEQTKQAIGKSAQWVEYPILKEYLKRNEFDQALELTRNVDSFNSLVQNQYYYDLMTYALDHGKKTQCIELFDEVMQKGQKAEIIFLAKIAKRLDDPAMRKKVLDAAKTQLDLSLAYTEPPLGGVSELERRKVGYWCGYAEIQYILGKTEDAEQSFAEAFKQLNNITDPKNEPHAKRQLEWAKIGIANTQVDLGLVDDAFQTISMINDKEIETEGWERLGSSLFFKNNGPTNARKALEKAQAGLKQINNSRIFGLVNDLELRIGKEE